MRVYIQGLCYPPDHSNGWISSATLDTSKIGQVDFRVEGKLLLRKAAL